MALKETAERIESVGIMELAHLDAGQLAQAIESDPLEIMNILLDALDETTVERENLYEELYLREQMDAGMRERMAHCSRWN